MAAPGASAAERSVFGRSVEGRPIVAVPQRRARRGADGARGRLHPRRRDGGDAGRAAADRRRRAARRRRSGSSPPSTPTASPPAPAATPTASTSTATSPSTGARSAAANTRGRGALRAGVARGRRLIQRIRPDLTIWFHQPFGLVDRSGGDALGRTPLRRSWSACPWSRLPGRYPGGASRWQNHAFPHSTAFVVELPATVGPALVRRATRRRPHARRRARQPQRRSPRSSYLRAIASAKLGLTR